MKALSLRTRWKGW